MSTYSPIATQTLTSTETSITFTNIPQGYTDLILRVDDQVSGASGFKIQFNGDTNANYQQIQMGGYASTSSADKFLNRTSIYNNLVYGDSTTANIYTPNIIQIQNYSNSYAYKSLLWRYGTATAAGGNSETFLIAGSWNSNSPITSITVSVWNAVNFIAGSSFNLYGIAAGSTKAQGGLVTNDGTYYYHTFLSSGVFTPYQALTCDYLVVAAGGGGGQNTGGGGGAGGYRTSLGSSALSLTAQNYAVTVGAGGLGGNFMSNVASAGVNGSNSSFSTITSSGGGGGAGSGTTADGLGGKNGGSGGGASRGAISAQNGGAGNSGGYSPVEGYAGGNNGTQGTSGGGGGAGAVGGNAGSSAGNGGDGRNTNSAWATATNTGVNGYYAGGGGGGSYDGPAGAGGAGGGGAGSRDSIAVPVNGTANTGGGGGGANNNNTPPNGNRGANGGSGIVIVRYAI